MQMRQRDEEKRSKLWIVVMLASSMIILLVVVFFIVSPMVRNPLEGEWIAEEKGYYMDVDDDKITVIATIDGEEIEVDLSYTLDQKDKILTIKSNTSAYAEAAKDAEGNISAGEIDEALESFIASYDYSMEGGKLTLTEREFANKFVFTRVEE